MCAIVDNDVGGEVFGDNPPEAARYFLNWLDGANGATLAIGGKLRLELCANQKFLAWLRNALLRGRALSFDDEKVDSETESLREMRICRSNDWHVLALAKISGARLLYTKDIKLEADFKDREIIDGVRGRVYTTRRYPHVTDSQKRLLRRRDLCDIR